MRWPDCRSWNSEKKNIFQNSRKDTLMKLSNMFCLTQDALTRLWRLEQSEKTSSTFQRHIHQGAWTVEKDTSVPLQLNHMWRTIESMLKLKFLERRTSNTDAKGASFQVIDTAPACSLMSLNFWGTCTTWQMFDLMIIGFTRWMHRMFVVNL